MPRRARSGEKRITTLSSRQFNQDASKAKQAARAGPVVITHRGRPSHVLLTIEDYRRLAGPPSSVIDLLAAPGAEDVAFEPPRIEAPYRAAAPLV
jgi:prevent-host-death family protein